MAMFSTDGRLFASHPIPAKIDLTTERPRRESIIDKQLDTKIGHANPPQIQITEQRRTIFEETSGFPSNQQMATSYAPGGVQYVPNVELDNNMAHLEHQQQLNRQLMSNFKKVDHAAIRAAELAQKEAKLMADIDAFSSRPYSPYKTPGKIDFTVEHRKLQEQTQHTQSQSPRPYSRTSSTRSPGADLAEKEAKLLQEIEEIERKPFNPQTLVVEREQWYEYPDGSPSDRVLMDSKRRIKDFCSMPPGVYQDGRHVHEEMPASLGRPSSAAAGNLHTAIISTPRREIDNRSPLPFSFDNLTTKGVRGNIASVGAIEPDRPRPPIYPIVKRDY